MKVLFLQHSLGYGGAAKSLLVTQQALAPDIDIYTVVPKAKTKGQKTIATAFKHSIEVTEIDIPTVYSYSERTIDINEFQKRIHFCPSELIKIINEKRIDILHVNSTLFSHVLQSIQKQTNCKIVVHLREMLPYGCSHPVDSYIIEHYSKYADAIISISDNELNFFHRRNNVFVIPNPHDFSLTDTLVVSAKKPAAPTIIGMCSNFVKIKGHIVFLEAAKKMQNICIKNPDSFEFRIIGYPESKFDPKRLANKILRRGYQFEFDEAVKKHRINHLNITPFSFDIYRDLAAIDIFVRPDLSGHPWGRDVIEAMALKKPVIATGTSEFFVKNGVTGYLVPPSDPERLAEKIMELVNDPQKRVAMGEAGYKKVKGMCDLNDYGAKLMSIYESLLQ